MESLLADDINSAGLKYANPGEEGGSVDDHIHHDFIEWWVVLQGELDFDMGDYPRFRAEKGDIVISPLGTRHLIIAAGDGPSLRLIVGKPGSSHQETKKTRHPDRAVPRPKSSRPT